MTGVFTEFGQVASMKQLSIGVVVMGNMLGLVATLGFCNNGVGFLSSVWDYDWMLQARHEEGRHFSI